MPRLAIQDQLAVKAPQVFPVAEGKNSHEALQERFKKIPINEVKLFINGSLVLHTDPIMHKPLKADDILTIQLEVKKFIGNIVSGIFDIAGDVLGFVLDPLIPDVPEFDTRS